MARLLKPDSGNDLLLQNNGNTSSIKINDDQSIDVTLGTSSGDDFAINSTYFVVEGDTGYVGIGTTAPDELLHLKSSATLEPVIKIENSNADNKCSMLHFVKSTTNEADDDFLGQIDFDGMNSASELLTYGRLTGISKDVSDGEEDGRVYIAAVNAGTLEATFNVVSGKVGIGDSTPSYQLELSTDSAGKPSTNTWTVSSDERLKEDIEHADLDICYNVVKNLPLKRFKWRDDVYSTEQVRDRHKIGWIAQDVESVFPKAVNQYDFKFNKVYELDENGMEQKLISEDVIEDCRGLNVDQIYAVMFGAIQKLQTKVEALENA